jgi:hypothetical protein
LDQKPAATARTLEENYGEHVKIRRIEDIRKQVGYAMVKEKHDQEKNPTSKHSV